MKRKIFLSMVTVGLVTLLAVTGAFAFSLGNVDGVWEYIEDIAEASGGSTNGAQCSRWATGPGNTPDTPTAASDWDRLIQTGSTTDENQVRYGNNTDCDHNNSTSGFSSQSGLGFDGRDNIGTNLVEATPFWLGRLSHYNKPITLNSPYNFLQWIDLDITITGVTCGNGQPPNEGSSLTFIYRINFDETPNQAPCTYDDPNVPNDAVCPDAVTIGANPTATSFTCDDPDEPVQSQGVYSIAILGFQPTNVYNGCASQTFNSSLVKTQYVTQENSTNHACLWGMITDFVPTAVDLKSFTAASVAGGIQLNWVTTGEVNNVGFHLYRAETLEGTRTSLNPEIIPSQVQPGSVDGAQYNYLDTTAVPGVAYYYWLEDVDLSGQTGFHIAGPATAGPQAWYKFFLPTIIKNH